MCVCVFVYVQVWHDTWAIILSTLTVKAQIQMDGLQRGEVSTAAIPLPLGGAVQGGCGRCVPSWRESIHHL